ncbi:MAG: lipase family protein, partial [Pseudoruegeria sp.]
TDVPVLLIHGTRDQFAPIDSARATNELFLGSGKTNLTYIELKGYDHFMVDQAGVDHKTDVVVRMAAWLQNGR